MIYLFNHTDFAVSELAHQTVKKVLLTMRFYCNKLNFPLSMSGRHPDGKGKLIPMQYAVMALAGTPDGKADFDADMAQLIFACSRYIFYRRRSGIYASI